MNRWPQNIPWFPEPVAICKSESWTTSPDDSPLHTCSHRGNLKQLTSPLQVYTDQPCPARQNFILSTSLVESMLHSAIPIGNLLSRSILRLRAIRSVILLLAIGHELPRTAKKTVQPEEIKSLQHSQQGKRDDVGNPALVLLSLPVEFIGTDGAKLGQERVKHTQIQKVTQVNPSHDIKSVKRDNPIRTGVVERFRDLLSLAKSIHPKSESKLESEPLTARKKSLISWVM